MKTFKNNSIIPFLALFGLLILQIQAQSGSAEKMAQLSFMVGDWEGPSKSYKDKDTIQVIAHEIVSYKVDKHLITLDLDSKALKLHTVIYYDEKEASYFYCPYYKKGAGKYKGSFKEGQFLVNFNENRRLIFQRSPEGYFHEYGEELKNGEWVKYFEDLLPPKKE